jgi:hypothetical protein
MFGRIDLTQSLPDQRHDPIRKPLEFGQLEAVVSVERQSVSKPVPEKVMDDMRRAGQQLSMSTQNGQLPTKKEMSTY